MNQTKTSLERHKDTWVFLVYVIYYCYLKKLDLVAVNYFDFVV